MESDAGASRRFGGRFPPQRVCSASRGADRRPGIFCGPAVGPSPPHPVSPAVYQHPQERLAVGAFPDAGPVLAIPWRPSHNWRRAFGGGGAGAGPGGGLGGGGGKPAAGIRRLDEPVRACGGWRHRPVASGRGIGAARRHDHACQRPRNLPSLSAFKLDDHPPGREMRGGNHPRGGPGGLRTRAHRISR